MTCFAILCCLPKAGTVPPVDCIVILRPTKIRSLYQRMVGRGMRLSPGKDHLLLLDFLWISARHDLCRPSALISRDEIIAQMIDEKMKSDDEGIDLIEAEEQAERDVLAEREAALAKQLAEMRGKKRKLVDPLQYAVSIAAEDLTNYVPTFVWEMAPPSENQLAFLERRGIFADSVRNAGLASLLIDRLQRPSRWGLLRQSRSAVWNATASDRSAPGHSRMPVPLFRSLRRTAGEFLTGLLPHSTDLKEVTIRGQQYSFGFESHRCIGIEPRRLDSSWYGVKGGGLPLLLLGRLVPK